MNGGGIKSSIAVLLALIIAGAALWHGAQYASSITFKSPSLFTPSFSKVSILIVGDIMLDRNVRNKINAMGFDAFFAGVRDLISEADIAVGNLEGPFTTYESITASLKNKALQFTFDPALAPELSALGFDILGLANNHTLNFGVKGLNMTREYIRDAGMLYYGDPDNREEISVVAEKNGIKFGLIGFHEFSYINFDNVMAEIERLRPEVDVLIVTPHWGPEYESVPTEKMKTRAHEFIDRGADAVIGTHPHVVGSVEDYHNKKIFYSLGNFAFDQYFSEETSTGLYVIMEVEKRENKIVTNYKTGIVNIDRDGVREYNSGI
ncbi:MAG: CapA family protein [bacterium]|nr:CapA family protein [bacterium]